MLKLWISSSTTSRVVIFDSGLGTLKLPILKALSFDEPEEEEPARSDALYVLLERYFQWLVEFPEFEGTRFPSSTMKVTHR